MLIAAVAHWLTTYRVRPHLRSQRLVLYSIPNSRTLNLHFPQLLCHLTPKSHVSSRAIGPYHLLDVYCPNVWHVYSGMLKGRQNRGPRAATESLYMVVGIHSSIQYSKTAMIGAVVVIQSQSFMSWHRGFPKSLNSTLLYSFRTLDQDGNPPYCHRIHICVLFGLQHNLIWIY